MKNKVITSLHDLKQVDRSKIPSRQDPHKVLMCPPEYFQVVDVKNPYMQGNKKHIDRQRAYVQWNALKETFREIGKEVHVVEAVEGLEDMVFAANQTFPFLSPEGEKNCIPSQMKYPNRQKEVPYYVNFFKRQGYRILPADKGDFFEGTGDMLWHPKNYLLWGGYGHRTALNTYRKITNDINIPIIALHLQNDYFYHLDTCFHAISEKIVLITPDAFDEAGLEMIRYMFDDVIEVPYQEATSAFACNCIVLDEVHCIIQKEAAFTIAALKERGLTIHEVDTSEFMKSGGSVFCMKMMFY